jgi:transcription-repair coupling factor (superfamily II helicase)
MKGEPIREEKEVRIDLPVKAFVPPEWVGQEALRLELYRRIATARDHQELDQVRAEAEDRFGSLPAPVNTLFAVASLKLSAREMGIEEITTFRTQIRLKPVPEGFGLEAAASAEGASYHAATRTLNLEPPSGMGGEALTRWVEEVLAAGRSEDAA